MPDIRPVVSPLDARARGIGGDPVRWHRTDMRRHARHENLVPAPRAATRRTPRGRWAQCVSEVSALAANDSRNDESSGPMRVCDLLGRQHGLFVEARRA